MRRIRMFNITTGEYEELELTDRQYFELCGYTEDVKRDNEEELTNGEED